MRSVVMDGVEIPETLLAQEVQNHPCASAAEARAAAGHALALRALLLDRARQLGIKARPERDPAGREETGEEALVRMLLEQELEVETPTDAECRRFYQLRRRRFRSPALYEASHILVPTQGDQTEVDAARLAAQRLIEQITDTPHAFAELARAISACPSGEVGGSLGQLRPGELAPELETMLEALAPGEVGAEPVLSRFGWHVLRLDRRIEGRDLPYEAVEDRIRLHLESRAWTAAAARYAVDLTAAARAKGIALSLTPEGAVAAGSATLGDLLGGRQPAARLEPWLAATDPSLAERLARAAEVAGQTPADFVAEAFADFLDTADDERWTNLISAARDADDPALACLAAVLRSKIQPAKPVFTLIRRA